MKTKLIEDRKSCGYSLCGRTDKGVSALGNVVSLYLRSRPNHKDGEYDYARMINRQLPNDIRIISYKIVPHHFDARFSCLYREYRYFFMVKELDIDRIKAACEYFVGVHDFKNFCKEDMSKKKSTIRRILSCYVEQKGNIGEIRIQGYSFLWHQVRCMVAIMFKVGLGVEDPDIVKKLLESKGEKPHYEIASDIGLVLYDCAFETLQFDNEEDVEENARCLFEVYENLIIRLEITNCIFESFKPFALQSKKKHKKLKVIT